MTFDHVKFSYTEQKELESTYVMTTYGRKPVEFISGAGMRLYDSEGSDGQFV